ncbi:MAG: Zn-ribbon domain-containing OB-fold protein [Catenulispora sp.]
MPVPDALTAPFWAAAARGRLVVPECSACGLRFFVPEPACPRCLGERWEYVACSGGGTVYSVTVVHRTPGPGFQTPFALCIVDLDDGPALLTHVVGCDPEKVEIGMPVRVVFQRLTEEIVLPCFTPELVLDSGA